MTKLHIKLDIQRFAVSSSVSSSVVSQSIENNNSIVRITFTVERTSGTTYWNDNKTLTFTCDGQTGTTSFSFPSGGGVGKTKSTYYDFTIPHNSDGTKSISYSARIVTGTSSGTLNPTGSATLSTIPRYTSTTNWSVASKTETSITLNWSTSNTCSQIRYGTSTSSYTTLNVSGSSGQVTISGLTANTGYTLYFMPKRSDSGLWGNGSANNWSSTTQTTYDYPKVNSLRDISLKLDETFQIGLDNPLNRTFDYQIISNVDSSVILSVSQVSGSSITVPMSSVLDEFYETIPNDKEGTYYVKITYSGNIRSSASKKYTIDADTCKPQMSVVSYEDINATTLALTGDDQSLIDGYSTIQVTISANNKATARKYATITGYKIENGLNSSAIVPEVDGQDVVLTILATSSIIKIYAIDSREQSGTYEIANADLISYTAIQKNQNSIAQRCDSQGDPNGVGEYVKITLGGTYWNDTFGDVTNAIQSISYNYANAKTPSQTTTGSTTIIATTSNNNYNVSQLILGDTTEGFDVANSYIINVTISDKLSSTTFTMTLASGTPHIAYSPNGVSIMGKYNEEVGGLLQVGGQPIQGGTSGDTLPIGAIMPYGGSTIPENWLECNGQAVSRTTYADLFSAIGTAFGSGDGSTTFNLPNFNGRSAIGYNSSDSNFNAIGKTFGNKTISYTPGGTVQSHTLTANQSGLRWHDHSINLRLIYCAKGSSDYWTVPWGSGDQGTMSTNGSGGWDAAEGHSHGFSGTSATLNVVHPVLVTKYIIKVSQSAGIVGSVSNTYSDSAVSSYSCSYINSQKETYSTNEQVIGTWIDGKKIYRKVVALSNVTISSNYTIPGTKVDNLDTFTNVVVICKNGNGSGFQFLSKAHPTTWDWVMSYYYSSGNGLIIEAGSSAVNSFNYDIYITMEYTKSS